METIQFKQLTFQYPSAEREALKDLCFAIEQSEFVVLCGKSGCGKSTLLHHMKKNLMPHGRRDGEVLYGQVPVAELPDRVSASEIGFVRQNPDNQIVTDKVWHELAFGLESLGLDHRAIRRRVAEMASYFDIESWFHKGVHELSGGQKQLLNLASIMVMQPRLFVLDEPTAHLNPIAASEFIQVLYKINRDLGTTVVISEHRLEELFPIADRVMVMDEGKIIFDDTPEKVGCELKESNGTGKHPLFYGLPSVMRIASEICPGQKSPLTIRDGRLWLEHELMQYGIEKSAGPAGKDALLPEERGAGVSVHEVSSDDRFSKDTKLANRASAIALKDIWFSYEKHGPHVLRGLSIQVARDSLYCLLGGNGSGKTTALKIISGIAKPQRGKIFINGVAVKKSTDKALLDYRLSMVPQNPQALFTERVVEDELREGLRYLKASDEEKFEKIEAMLELMQITQVRKAHPYDLSGGEQQRLALAKILLQEPQILLLDEPTKGLDPFFKRTLGATLRQLTHRGVTIFMVSHDIEFCAEYADMCGMLFDGDIVSAQSSKRFFSGNNFYTTAANKIVREWNVDATTCEEVIRWIQTTIQP